MEVKAAPPSHGPRCLLVVDDAPEEAHVSLVVVLLAQDLAPVGHLHLELVAAAREGHRAHEPNSGGGALGVRAGGTRLEAKAIVRGSAEHRPCVCACQFWAHTLRGGADARAATNQPQGGGGGVMVFLNGGRGSQAGLDHVALEDLSQVLRRLLRVLGLPGEGQRGARRGDAADRGW